MFPSDKTQMTESEKDAFHKNIDKQNRWVILRDEIYWDKLIAIYLEKHDFTRIHPEVPPRTIIAALIIKYKLKLSSRATVQLISENQYLQYFAQAGRYYDSPPLTPELLRNIRDIYGKREWSKFKNVIINQSFSTLLGKISFKVRMWFKKKPKEIVLVAAKKNKFAQLDTELHASIGLDYQHPTPTYKGVSPNRKKTSKLKKELKRYLDIAIWIVILGLVIGSLAMIIYESDWATSKKKNEKNK